MQKEAHFLINMKTFLTSSALLLAAGYPCVAFAESFGLHVPTFINVNGAVTLFSLALFALLALGDYRRTPRALGYSMPAPRKPRETHRLAA